MMYDYRVVTVNKVIDGDTVDATIDLGFGLWASFRFRLTGVDTPERGHADWQRATDFTKAWFAVGDGVTVKTQKSGPSTGGIGDGAFGRWLGEFFRGEQSLSAALIAEGWGV